MGGCDFIINFKTFKKERKPGYSIILQSRNSRAFLLNFFFLLCQQDIKEDIKVQHKILGRCNVRDGKLSLFNDEAALRQEVCY